MNKSNSLLERLRINGASPLLDIIEKNKGDKIKEVVVKGFVDILKSAAYDLKYGEHFQFVEYNSPIEEVCRQLGFDKVDFDEINSYNFHQDKKGSEEIIIKMSKESVRLIGDFKVETGYRFSTFNEVGCHCLKYPELLENFKIAIMGSVFVDEEGFNKIIVFEPFSVGDKLFKVAYVIDNATFLRRSAHTLLTKI